MRIPIITIMCDKLESDQVTISRDSEKRKYYLIDPQGSVVREYDIENSEEVLDDANNLAREWFQSGKG